MRMNAAIVALCLITAVVLSCAAPAACGAGSSQKIWLSDLDIRLTQQGSGEPRHDASVDNNPLRIGGRTFEHGLGTHADSILYIRLDSGSSRFTAWVGVDDEVNNHGSVEFRILADGKEIYHSGLRKGGEPAQAVDVDVSGVNMLVLLVDSGPDNMSYDHADWADAAFAVVGSKPEAMNVSREKAVILTPQPAAQPRINGAMVFGVRPGSPVLYTIAATGQRPMAFNAENLPAGLSIDRATGQITGRAGDPGAYAITLSARNDLGEARRTLRLVVGKTIALTPPLGWNTWNCWGCAVDQDKIFQAADAMVASGLSQHGWQYINIDDCWMVKLKSADPVVGGPTRDEGGQLLTNKRFPDMKALTDYVHRQGLKAGLYISPGPWTCQEYEGSWRHEQLDARRFAEWGFDYLKYDWCGYGFLAPQPTLEELKEPYLFMGMCLKRVSRDIVYSLCQYGMGDVWKWGAEVGGNCWRTTGDIADNWGSMSGIGFAQDALAPYAGPGHWNDPDMLVVGKVGWGPSLRDTHLTPNEQYTHISLWCLLSAPLLIGCDLTQLDEFTLNLLTNDEVLEVDQDPLGAQAHRVAQNGSREVWAKKMEDGSVAAGLFHRGEIAKTVTVNWADLGLSGKLRVRDLWRQKDLGTFDGRFETEVPRHGVVLVRLFPPQQ